MRSRSAMRASLASALAGSACPSATRWRWTASGSRRKSRASVLRQRAVRADVTAFAERDEPGGARVHVAARVAEGERGDGEVGEQVDALEVERRCIASPYAPSYRVRSGGVVPATMSDDAGPATGHRRGEAERLVVRLLADSVGERDAGCRPSTSTSPRLRRLAGEVLGASPRRAQPGGGSRSALRGSAARRSGRWTPCRRGPIRVPVPLLLRPADGLQPRDRVGSPGRRSAGRTPRRRGGR